MEEEIIKIQIINFLPSFLSVLSVEHLLSGWCSTDETVSHLETDWLFCLKSKNCLHPQLPQNVHATRKTILKWIQNSYYSEHI